MLVRVAEEDVMLTAIVTTVVEAGEPQVNETVPVSVEPGCAAAKVSGSKVTGMPVPKLYASPFRKLGCMMGASVPLVVML
jgi:hypothetical protein